MSDPAAATRRVDFTSHGQTVHFELPAVGDHIQDTIARLRTFYEAPLLEDLRERLRGPGLVIDVGANIGNHSVYFGRVLGLKVIAIEPFEPCYATLLRNIELNELTQVVTPMQAAAGAQAGRGATVVVNPTNLGQTRVELKSDGAVRVLALDELKTTEPVLLIKIDVEGMEIDVINGARALIQKHRPLLCVEAADRQQRAALRRLLGEIGYMPVSQSNATPTFVCLPAGSLAEQQQALADIAESLWREKEERAAAGTDRAALAGLSERLKGLEGRTTGLRDEFASLNQQIDAMEQHFKTAVGAAHETLRWSLTRHVESLEQALERAEQRCTALEQKLAESLLTGERLAVAESELVAAKTRLAEAQRALQQASAERVRIEQDFEATQSRLRELDQRLKRLTAQQERDSGQRRVSEGRAERLGAQCDRLKKELSLVQQGVRYQIGDAFVKAARPSLDTLLLPFRLTQLFFTGLRRVLDRRKARHEGREQAARALSEAQAILPEHIAAWNRASDPGAGPPPGGPPSSSAANGRNGSAAPAASAFEVERPTASHLQAWNKTPAPSSAPADGLVSVIMTTYNSRAFVGEAIESILRQTHRELELIVVDDASSDGTFELLTAAAQRDARVRPVQALRNSGTYCAKNLGLTLARGACVTFQDSDDRSLPDRIAKQLALLRKSKWAVASTCNYERRDEQGQVVLNRGLRERRALISLMFRRPEVLARIGYFDSVRTSADDEFLQRIKLVFGAESIVHVDEPLYQASYRDGSLTTAGPAPTDMSKADADVEEFLSPARKEYFDAYKAWHERLGANGESPLIPFPLTRRRFAAPATILPRPEAQRAEFVQASLASIPARVECLAGVVKALLPQVDRLNVYLNHYESVPDFLKHEKIRVARSQDTGDQRDNGKFFFLTDAQGYYFTADDDIHYPPDYVQRMILKIEQYERRAIVGVHGVLLADPLVRFFENRTVLHFKQAQACDRFVHLLGTGTVAFHRDTLRLSPADFGTPGMADLWLAVAAKRQGVPLRCLARPANWLRPMEGEDDSLYTEFVRRDEEQTRIALENGPWTRAAMTPVWATLAGTALSRFSQAELASRDIDPAEWKTPDAAAVRV